MPLLQVVNSTKFEIGRFGGSFLDLYKVPKELNNGQGKYLPRNLNPTVSSGAVSIGMGTSVCVSGFKQNPERRSYFSIDLTALRVPVETCGTPEGKQKFFDQFRSPCPHDDPFLNRDPNQDYINGENILDTVFGNKKYQASGTGNNVEVVSAISFSLTKSTSFNPTYDATIDVHWARGMDTSGSCPSATIHRPLIVPDQRNEEGLNIARYGYKGQWWLSGSRYYLEIRHGLNTEDYSAIVNDGGWFVQIPKKNSLILSRYIEQSTSFLEKNKKYEPDESMFELPKGRINVTIFADPCDITGQTDPASVG